MNLLDENLEKLNNISTGFSTVFLVDQKINDIQVEIQDNYIKLDNTVFEGVCVQKEKDQKDEAKDIKKYWDKILSFLLKIKFDMTFIEPILINESSTLINDMIISPYALQYINVSKYKQVQFQFMCYDKNKFVQNGQEVKIDFSLAYKIVIQGDRFILDPKQATTFSNQIIHQIGVQIKQDIDAFLLVLYLYTEDSLQELYFIFPVLKQSKDMIERKHFNNPFQNLLAMEGSFYENKMVNPISAENIDNLIRQQTQFGTFCRLKHPILSTFGPLETIIYEKLIVGGSMQISHVSVRTGNDAHDSLLANAFSLLKTVCQRQEIRCMTEEMIVQQVIVQRNAIRSQYSKTNADSGTQTNPDDIKQILQDANVQQQQDPKPQSQQNSKIVSDAKTQQKLDTTKAPQSAVKQTDNARQSMQTADQNKTTQSKINQSQVNQANANQPTANTSVMKPTQNINTIPEVPKEQPIAEDNKPKLPAFYSLDKPQEKKEEKPVVNTQFAALTRQNRDLEERISEMEQQLQGEKKEGLKRELQYLIDSIARLKVQLGNDSLFESIDQLQNKNKDLNQQILELNTQQEEYVQTIQKTKDKIQHLEDKFNKYFTGSNQIQEKIKMAKSARK